MSFLLVLALCLPVSLAVAASTAHGQGLEDPIPKPIREGGPPIALIPVADGLTAPNWGTAPAVHPDRLFVTDQAGIVWNLRLATGDKAVFADLSDRLVALGIGGPNTYDERGLLGLAFHPDYAANGHVYTYTSEPVDGPADFSTMPPDEDPDHQSVVMEWTVADPLDPDSAIDPATGREILRIDQPQFNHDAGVLIFGPDGALYIPLGDGGAADDQGVGHVPGGNGQEPGNVLGSILRIDPLGSNSANGQYGIPADNPFVGDPDARDEIWAYGFRNPFRCSFDRQTGELYCADVGQNDIEEVDVIVPGGNYGWPVKEGSFLFDQNGDGDGFVYGESGDGPPELIDPIAEYDHDEGIAIVGGFVYRGDSFPALRGRYVFGDYAEPGGDGGRLFFLKYNGGPRTAIREMHLVGDGLTLSLLGFGEDATGEIYVLASGAGIPFGDTGVVFRLTPALGTNPEASRAPKAALSTDAAPNPFNPTTRIQYDLQAPGHLSIRVYDLRGALVRELVDGTVPAGPGSVTWNGVDAVGRRVASGVYFYEVRALGQRSLQKLTLTK